MSGEREKTLKLNERGYVCLKITITNGRKLQGILYHKLFIRGKLWTLLFLIGRNVTNVSIITTLYVGCFFVGGRSLNIFVVLLCWTGHVPPFTLMKCLKSVKNCCMQVSRHIIIPKHISQETFLSSLRVSNTCRYWCIDILRQKQL